MITLYLAGRVRPGGRGDLEAFLADATPFYEAPGRIRVRLQWALDDPDRFLEIMEYADAAAYSGDQVRVAADPTMRAYLARWRTLLAAPVEVTVFAESTTVH